MKIEKKLQKKKKRDKAKRKKILENRLASRKEKKEARDLELRELKMDKVVPILSDEERLDRLKRNNDILQALEDEYLAEVENRKQVNEDLSEKGLETIEEKMDYLKDKAKDAVNQEYADTGDENLKLYGAEEDGNKTDFNEAAS